MSYKHMPNSGMSAVMEHWHWNYASLGYWMSSSN